MSFASIRYKITYKNFEFPFHSRTKLLKNPSGNEKQHVRSIIPNGKVTNMNFSRVNKKTLPNSDLLTANLPKISLEGSRLNTYTWRGRNFFPQVAFSIPDEVQDGKLCRRFGETENRQFWSNLFPVLCAHRSLPYGACMEITTEDWWKDFCGTAIATVEMGYLRSIM